MKKLMMISILAALSTSSFAQFFNANAQVYMDRTQATVEVVNNLPMPIVCSGRAEGVTMNGQIAYSYMNNMVIYPGGYAHLMVYTNNYNPFRFVRPFVNCQTL